MSLKEKFSRGGELVEQAAFLDDRPIEGKFSFDEFFKLSNGEKFLQLLHGMKDVLPDSFTSRGKLKKVFYNDKLLPFNPEKYSFEALVGRGGTSMVYLLESLDEKKKSWVMKVFKNKYLEEDFGGDRCKAASFLKETLQKVKSWYGDELEHIFLPEYILESRGPKNKDSLIVLQPYLGGEIRDIFLEVRDGEWSGVLENNHKLRNDIALFAKKTFQHEEKTGEVLDFIGTKNVSISCNKGEGEKGINYRLLVFDPHYTYSMRENGDEQRILSNRLDHLGEIKDIVQKY